MQSVQQLWLAAPTVLVLPPDRVHVWRAELDKISAICWQQLAKTLSEDEQIRAEKFILSAIAIDLSPHGGFCGASWAAI